MRRLSNSEVKELIRAGLDISKRDIVEIVNIDGTEVMRVNGTYAFFMYSGRWVPTLKRIYEEKLSLKSVYVDMGAVKFVSNGADVMRPGIVRIDDGINTGDIIGIKEISHDKIIALGEALLSSEGIKNASTGKMAKNIHYIGDKLWCLG
ncbi:MAG: PUA domain-containing protein [Candidatus Micrarchaeia archaeon]